MDFETRFNQGNRSYDISKYIPKKLYDAGAIQHACIDSDGYWIYLNEGWHAYDGADDCATIHECTIKDLKDAVKGISYTGGNNGK